MWCYMAQYCGIILQNSDIITQLCEAKLSYHGAVLEDDSAIWVKYSIILCDIGPKMKESGQNKAQIKENGAK